MPTRTNPSPDHGYPAKTWRITPKGYVRFVLPVGIAGSGKFKQKMGHVWVWEQHYGPVPKGKQVHHKNEVKTDNRIENLELVDALTHKRIHSGCTLIAGIWMKPCNACEETKPITGEHWYMVKGKWPFAECKPCHIKRATKDKKKRREAKK